MWKDFKKCQVKTRGQSEGTKRAFSPAGSGERPTRASFSGPPDPDEHQRPASLRLLRGVRRRLGDRLAAVRVGVRPVEQVPADGAQRALDGRHDGGHALLLPLLAYGGGQFPR